MFLLTGRSPKVVRYLMARCDRDYVYRVSDIQATRCCKEHGVRVLGFYKIFIPLRDKIEAGADLVRTITSFYSYCHGNSIYVSLTIIITKFVLLTYLLPFLVTKGSRVLEKKLMKHRH